MWREEMNRKGQREIKTGKKLEEMKLWGVKNGKGHTGVSDGGMQNERKKKDEGEDYRAGVRENQAAALQAPVNPILITSQCVEHQLFFDPFVMISIQPVRTVPIQNGFCRISRYCVTVCLTKHSLESCISNSLPHVCMCAIRSARAAHCFWKVPYFCV